MEFAPLTFAFAEHNAQRKQTLAWEGWKPELSYIYSATLTGEEAEIFRRRTADDGRIRDDDVALLFQRLVGLRRLLGLITASAGIVQRNAAGQEVVQVSVEAIEQAAAQADFSWLPAADDEDATRH